MPGNRWFIHLEEWTGKTGIADVCPATGVPGMRSGAFFVSDEFYKGMDISQLVLETVLSHSGQEEDRIRDTDGYYIDEFGMYVYSTSRLGHKINMRHDTDHRYDLKQLLPWSVAGSWDDRANVSRRLAPRGSGVLAGL